MKGQDARAMFHARIIFLAASLALIAGAAALRHVQSRPVQIEEEEAEAFMPDRGGIVTHALAAAYPGRIEKVEFRDGDWAVLMDDAWYYYAGGRMLPEALRGEADDYSPIFFYQYRASLPPLGAPPSVPEISPRDERGRSGGGPGERPRAARRQRSYHFQEDLWRSRTRGESAARMKTVTFLNHKLPVHGDIAEALAKVERFIAAAALGNPEVAAWVSSIGETHGWNWRNVAGTQSRSYHSYGIAIDILPRSLGGKETYWQWAAQRGKDWRNIPYEDRYHPPDAVIMAFELYGFVWGGKWPWFDTMHFEYRPEVFTMAGHTLP